MSEPGDIPTLTDLIEKGIEIKMSDLGLDDDLAIQADDDIEATEIDVTEPELDGVNSLELSPALEQAIRRILDEHTELALQEIKLLLQRNLK